MQFPEIEIKTVIFWIFAITSASFLAAAGQYAFRKFWYRDENRTRREDNATVLAGCATNFSVMTDSLARIMSTIEAHAFKYIPVIEKHETEIAVLQEQHRNIMAALSRIEAAVDKFKK